jgi:hypothetical protein
MAWSKRAKQWFSLDETQLWRLVGRDTYRGASEALERLRKIREAGGDPVIFYSDFNGFRVLDESNVDQLHIAASIGDRSKPFPI